MSAIPVYKALFSWAKHETTMDAKKRLIIRCKWLRCKVSGECAASRTRDTATSRHEQVRTVTPKFIYTYTGP